MLAEIGDGTLGTVGGAQSPTVVAVFVIDVVIGEVQREIAVVVASDRPPGDLLGRCPRVSEDAAGE